MTKTKLVALKKICRREPPHLVAIGDTFEEWAPLAAQLIAAGVARDVNAPAKEPKPND